MAKKERSSSRLRRKYESNDQFYILAQINNSLFYIIVIMYTQIVIQDLSAHCFSVALHNFNILVNQINNSLTPCGQKLNAGLAQYIFDYWLMATYILFVKYCSRVVCLCVKHIFIFVFRQPYTEPLFNYAKLILTPHLILTKTGSWSPRSDVIIKHQKTTYIDIHGK